MTEAKHINSEGERFRQWVSGGREVQREEVLHSGFQRAGKKGSLPHSQGQVGLGVSLPYLAG